MMSSVVYFNNLRWSSVAEYFNIFLLMMVVSVIPYFYNLRRRQRLGKVLRSTLWWVLCIVILADRPVEGSSAAGRRWVGSFGEGTGVGRPAAGRPAEGSFVEGRPAEGSLAEGSFAEDSLVEDIFGESSFAEGSFAEGSFVEGSFVEGSFAEGSFAEGGFAVGSFAAVDFEEDSFAEDRGHFQNFEGSILEACIHQVEVQGRLVVD